MPAPQRRRPKGSYVRATGDWFIDRAATVGGSSYPAPTLAPFFDLFNNANDGSALYVYKIMVGNDASETYGMTQIGGHGGAFLQNAVPVVTGNPSLPGQLFTGTLAAQFAGTTPPNGTTFSDAMIGINVAGPEDFWDAPGPLCVISVGDSLRVYGITGAGLTQGAPLAVSFYFVALPD